MDKIAKKVVLLMKQDREKVADIENMTLSISSKEKNTLKEALKGKYKGFKVNGTFKVSKTWTNKAGVETTKEFDGVELQKEDVIKKPLFVREGNVLSIWN